MAFAGEGKIRGLQSEGYPLGDQDPVRSLLGRASLQLRVRTGHDHPAR